MTAYFIINGRVIDPARKMDERLNVFLENGKVIEWTKSRKTPSGAKTLDAKGCIVAPGFIDMHAHLRDPGFEYKEDIETGSRAAARGGFTTVCCMPNTKPVNDCAAVTEYILERAKAVGVVDVRPVGAISRGLKGEELADIGDLAKAGVVGISDDGNPVMNAMLMRRACEYSSAFGIPVISHSEDLNLRGNGVLHEGAVSTELGLKGIPGAVEEIMVSRDIQIASLTGAHIHITHVSSAGSVELISCAKKRKIPVTADVTPHHLTLTHEAASDFDTNTKVNPPFRTEDDKSALIRALAGGTIDAIATDHAPHNIIEKEVGYHDAAFGVIGLETALPLVLKLVHDKKLLLKRAIEALTIAPARILKLKGKGTLAPGSVADCVIFDPLAAWTIDAGRFASKSRNTPFDGMRVLGRVKTTIASGKIAYSE